MVIAECNPSKIHLRHPETGVGARRFLITVNHFTSEEMQIYDASSGDGEYLSADRYDTAFDALKNEKHDNAEYFAKDILSGKYGFMCQYKKETNFDTIWSSVFNLTSGEIYRAEGNPKRVKYIKDDRFLNCLKTY